MDLIGYPVLPVGIEGSEATVRALLVADLDDGTLLQGTIPDPPTLAGALRLLDGVFSGRNHRKQRGLPREAVFADRELHDAFAPTLTPLGVECRYEPGHPLFEDLKESMQEWMRSGRPEPRAASAPERSEAPPRQATSTVGSASTSRFRRSAAGRPAGAYARDARAA